MKAVLTIVLKGMKEFFEVCKFFKRPLSRIFHEFSSVVLSTNRVRPTKSGH
jgi:hypothetical protein